MAKPVSQNSAAQGGQNQGAASAVDASLAEAAGASAVADASPIKTTIGGVEILAPAEADDKESDTQVQPLNSNIFGQKNVRGPIRTGKPQKPNYKTYIVSTRGVDIGRVPKAIDESDAIAQVVKSFKINDPENYQFQCRLA